MPPSDYKLLYIRRSKRAEKKFVAVFEHKETKRTRTTHFGARAYSDYTIHKDPDRKARYIARHTDTNSEDWSDPTSAGALSRWILWNKPSLLASIADYKHRFGLD